MYVDILLCTYVYLTCFVRSSGNSHVALTLLCRSLGTNGTKPQHTIGLSPPMAAGAAKGRMYICVCGVYYTVHAEGQRQPADPLA